MGRQAAPVGRAAELARARRLLAEDTDRRVLFVHGPGGIGKSTLVRALADDAQALGYDVWWRAAPDLAASSAPLEEVAEQLGAYARRLLVIDGCEGLTALVSLLRRRIAPMLGPADRLVVVSRERPEIQWHAGLWDDAVLAVTVRALAAADAAAVAEAHGVDATAAERIAGWSEGLPLAVALAADLVAAGDLDVAGLDRDPELGTVLLDHLLGERMLAGRRRVLATTALAGTVDDRLLRAVLPDLAEADGEAWVRSLPYAVPAGSGVRLHDTVAAVIVRALAGAAPEEDVELRRRLADTYLRRALAGDPRGIVALGTLVRGEVLRWGLGGVAGREIQATQARPDDAGQLLASAGFDPRRTASTRRWFEEAPEYVVVSRWADGTPAGFGIACTTHHRPAWAEEDPVLGPWLAAAEKEHPGRIAFLARDVVDLGGPDDVVSGPMAAGYPRAMLSFGADNPGATYATGGHKPSTGSGTEPWLAAMGYRPHPELAAGASPADRCWIADHGEGGIAADTWRVVLADLGITPPRTLPVLDAAQVRALLRGWHDPSVLAASPLAYTGAPAERAEQTRARVLAATDRLAQAQDGLLADLLRRTFLDPDASVAAALRELPLSRATYYRRLDDAISQLTTWLA